MQRHFPNGLIRRAMTAALAAMLVLINGPPMAAAAAPAANVLAPEQIVRLLEEGDRVLQQGNADSAIKKYFDPVLQSFMRQTAKAAADEEIYASHGASETLAYSGLVSAENEQAKGKTPLRMVAVDGAWTDALVLKARALVALKRAADAQDVLNQALTISPKFPTPWIELGAILQSERDWPRSQNAYRGAENATVYVDDKLLQTQLLGSALRGQAFALRQLARLDEADVLYKRALKLNPDDSVAQGELARSEELRAAPAANPPAATPAPATTAPPTPAPH